jgi:citrate lyase subunit beta/citryl-CoA lyase
MSDDLALCGTPGISAVLIPKAEHADAIATIAAALPTHVRFLPMIETATGFASALEIARQPRVHRLVFGSLDFQADLGIPDDDEALLSFRSHLVLVSRLAGVAPPVDGITTRFDTPELTTREAGRARRLGFGGKLCIHPKQLPWVRDVFAPSAVEIAWARRIVESTHRGDGATVVDGAMVDRPVLERALAILEGHDKRS